MRPKNRKYCVRAHKPKLCFESEKKALNFIKYNSEEIEEENGYAPIRAYYCTACCGWHLSSQPPRDPIDTVPKEKPKYKPSYSQMLINDQGYYHLIGYFKGSELGNWQVEQHGVRTKDPEIIREFWQAFGILCKGEIKELTKTNNWWVVRGPQGKMLINVSRGTIWILNKGEQVGTEFERLPNGLFYKGGEIKILKKNDNRRKSDQSIEKSNN